MFTEDVIDEVEFSMLFETVNKKNPSFPYWSYDRFDLNRVTDEECKSSVAPNGMIANLYGPVGETFHMHDLTVDQ